MQSTPELLLDLLRDLRALARTEFALARTEVGERAKGIPSSVAAIAVGAILLAMGLALVLVSASLALGRFGVPVDLGFLIVGAAAVLLSLVLLRSGAVRLKPSRLIPARSVSQVSSLLEEL